MRKIAIGVLAGISLLAAAPAASADADELLGWQSGAASYFGDWHDEDSISVVYQSETRGDLMVSEYDQYNDFMVCQGSLGQPTRAGSTLGINGAPTVGLHDVVVAPVFNFGNGQTELWSRAYADGSPVRLDTCDLTQWSAWTQLPTPADLVASAPAAAHVAGNYYVFVDVWVNGERRVIYTTSGTGRSWGAPWSAPAPQLPSGYSLISSPAVTAFQGNISVAVVAQQNSQPTNHWIFRNTFNVTTKTWTTWQITLPASQGLNQIFSPETAVAVRTIGSDLWYAYGNGTQVFVERLSGSTFSGWTALSALGAPGPSRPDILSTTYTWTTTNIQLLDTPRAVSGSTSYEWAYSAFCGTGPANCSSFARWWTQLAQ